MQSDRFIETAPSPDQKVSPGADLYAWQVSRNTEVELFGVRELAPAFSRKLIRSQQLAAVVFTEDSNRVPLNPDTSKLARCN